jgi:catalase
MQVHRCSALGETGMDDSTLDHDKLVQNIMEALMVPGGSPQRRPVHTVGIGATGHFEASEVAKRYCISEHFLADRVRVTMRFSNGMGVVEPHDGWRDVRGMAVRFHLSKGKATDLIAMTLPIFFAPDAKTFLQFARAARPREVTRQSIWQKILAYLSLELPAPDPYRGQTARPDEPANEFADQHDWAKPAVLVASQIGAPVSYVRAAYHAVHSFAVTGTDGQERWVRFHWQPVAGVLKTDPKMEPQAEYLGDDLRRRLGKGTERFTLMMTIGESGDNLLDPTSQWPLHRRRIMMGTLTLDAVAADQQAQGERLSFNPWLLPETGMRASADPVLAIRRDVYEYSSKQRHGIPCPFSGEPGGGK